MNTRFPLALCAWLIAGTTIAGALGLLAALPFQAAYGVGGLLLAALLCEAPKRGRPALVRLAGSAAEPGTSLALLGAGAALVFLGLGAHVLVASAVNDAFVAEVHGALVPGLPVLGGLLGLGRGARDAALRWVAAEDHDQP